MNNPTMDESPIIQRLRQRMAEKKREQREEEPQEEMEQIDFNKFMKEANNDTRRDV